MSTATVTTTRVDVAGGKYSVLLHSNGLADALRHGEPWPAYEGGVDNNLIESLAQELHEAREENAKLRTKDLRRLCGYVEDGTSDTLAISQDDATMEWVVCVGKRTYSGRSFDQAIDEAITDTEIHDPDRRARR